MAEASSSSSSALLPAAKDEEENFEIKLWQACSDQGNPDKLWFQDDLQSLEVMNAKDIHELVKCIQKLVDQCLFRSLEARDGRQCWRVVSDTVASKYGKRYHAHISIRMLS